MACLTLVSLLLLAATAFAMPSNDNSINETEIVPYGSDSITTEMNEVPYDADAVTTEMPEIPSRYYTDSFEGASDSDPLLEVNFWSDDDLNLDDLLALNRDGDEDVMVDNSTDTGDDEDRIINGFTARTGQFPFAVRLYGQSRTNPRSYSLCGGTILSSVWVLTAAHCVFPNIARAYVRAGVVQDRGGVVQVANRMFIHSRYRHFGGHDIALLRLDRPLRLSRTINRAFLSRLPNPRAGARQLTVGWGRIRPFGPQSFNLKGAWMTTTTCRSFLRNTPSRLSVICMFNGRDRACQGDSGSFLGSYSSPFRAVVRGVTSYGPRNCAQNTISGWTSVGYFLNWILAVVRSN